MYSKNGEIRRDETCLDYSGHDVVLYMCHGAKGNQLWLYDASVSRQTYVLTAVFFLAFNMLLFPMVLRHVTYVSFSHYFCLASNW